MGFNNRLLIMIYLNFKGELQRQLEQATIENQQNNPYESQEHIQQQASQMAQQEIQNLTQLHQQVIRDLKTQNKHNQDQVSEKANEEIRQLRHQNANQQKLSLNVSRFFTKPKCIQG